MYAWRTVQLLMLSRRGVNQLLSYNSHPPIKINSCILSIYFEIIILQNPYLQVDIASSILIIYICIVIAQCI